MATIEGIVFEDHDVAYKEIILQLGIVGVAELYAARCEEALLELGVPIHHGQGCKFDSLLRHRGDEESPKPWRSPGTGAQGDFMTVAVMDVERGRHWE